MFCKCPINKYTKGLLKLSSFSETKHWLNGLYDLLYFLLMFLDQTWSELDEIILTIDTQNI